MYGKDPTYLIDPALCTRCGACFAADESDVLYRDQDDFPLVKAGADPEKIQMLESVCSGSHWNFRELMGHVHGRDVQYDPSSPDIGVHESIHLVSSIDASIRLQGQSGGVSQTLLKFAFHSGLIDAALAVRRPKDDPFASESYIARSEADLADSAGSKYTVCTSLDKLKDLAESSTAFAMTLLPCQTAAFYKFAQNGNESLGNKCQLILGPFCGLSMERSMGPAFAEAAGFDHENVARFANRAGAFPGRTEFELSDGTIRPFDRSAHRILYRMFSPARCFSCTDYGNELADLVIADCWKQTATGEYEHPEGAAYVVVRTPRGRKFLKKALASGALIEFPIESHSLKKSWEMPFVYRKVRAHNRIRLFRKAGISVPELDYNFPPEFRESWLADRVELGAINVFKKQWVREPVLRWWVNSESKPEGSLRGMIYRDLKDFVFTHRHDQYNFHLIKYVVKRYSRKLLKSIFSSCLRLSKALSVVLIKTGYSMILVAKWILNIFTKTPEDGSERFEVLLTGGHGYRNVGDEAQLGANLEHWHKLRPDAHRIVFSPNPAYTSSKHGVQSEVGPRIVWFDANRSPDYGLSNDNFKQVFSRVSKRMLRAATLSKKGWPELFLLPAEVALLRTLSKADVLHISGGGFLTGMTQSRLWENALLMQLCHVLETPVILSGQTIGVFRDEEDRSLATSALQQARFIYLRDAGDSEADVRGLEIEGNHIVSLFDDALFCGKCDEQLTVKTLRENGINPDQPFVVVNFHYWGMSPELKIRSQQRFSEICDWMRKTRGVQVLLIPMSPSDEEAELDIQKEMSESAPLLNYNYDYRVARGIMSLASFVLTMKHHPIIFSQGEAVPALSVALDDYYFRKNFGAMANCGQEKFCLDASAFYSDSIFSSIDEILSQRDLIVNSLESYLQEQQPRAGECILRFLEQIH